MNFEFLKDRYDFELDRKDKLTSALALPVAVLTFLGGVGTAMLRSFSYRDQTLTLIFLVAMTGGFIAFTLSLVFLARAYLAQTYVYLPLLQDLDKAEEEFREFNAYVQGTGGEVEETFGSDLRQRIIKAADANTLSNDRRSKWMHWSRVSLFVVVGLAYVAGIAYVADQVRFANADTAGSETDRSAAFVGAAETLVPGEPGDQRGARAGNADAGQEVGRDG